MLKSVPSIFLLVSAFLATFGAGAFTAARSEWGMPIANIVVKNDTDQNIDSIVITYTTCGLTRKLVYKKIEQHKSNISSNAVPMKIVLCGEGSHFTEVTLSNGNSMTTKGSYIEGGYNVTEHITLSGINSEFAIFSP
jgi:hypothetical protein